MTTATKTIKNQRGEVFTITKEGPKSWYNMHAYGLTNRIVWRDQNDDMWVRANGEWIRVRYYTHGWLNASTNYNAVTPVCGELSAVEIVVEDEKAEAIDESTTESVEAVETDAGEQAETFEATIAQEQANELHHLHELTANGHKTVSLEDAYTAYKYSGGTYCGNGDFETLDECLEFADDGFCDYVRIVSAKGQTIKMRFTPTEKNMYL